MGGRGLNNLPPQLPASRDRCELPYAPPRRAATGVRPFNGAEVDAIIFLRLPPPVVGSADCALHELPTLSQPGLARRGGPDPSPRKSICTAPAQVVTKNTFYLHDFLYWHYLLGHYLFGKRRRRGRPNSARRESGDVAAPCHKCSHACSRATHVSIRPPSLPAARAVGFVGVEPAVPANAWRPLISAIGLLSSGGSSGPVSSLQPLVRRNRVTRFAMAQTTPGALTSGCSSTGIPFRLLMCSPCFRNVKNLRMAGPDAIVQRFVIWARLTKH